MGVPDFFKSKGFIVSISAMLVIVLVLGLITLSWLESTTNHGEEVVVPDLTKMNYKSIDERLKRENLSFVIVDSVDYRKDFPPLSVVEQDPAPGDKVKKNRKIYIKINASTFSQVKLPNLIQVSYRQAIPTLQSLGLQEGQITYEPNIGKDMVLKMMYRGRELKPGDKVTKSSKIDLVLGDGFMEVRQDDEDAHIQQLMEELNKKLEGGQ